MSQARQDPSASCRGESLNWGSRKLGSSLNSIQGLGGWWKRPLFRFLQRQQLLCDLAVTLAHLLNLSLSFPTSLADPSLFSSCLSPLLLPRAPLSLSSSPR